MAAFRRQTSAARREPQGLTPNRLWTGLLVLWMLFLSGFLARLGSPGALQALRLHSLLSDKEQQQDRLQSEILKLQVEAGRLEHDEVALKREIRKQLGYTAPDELIFDFTRPNTL